MDQWLPYGRRPPCVVLKGLFLAKLVGDAPPRRNDQLGKVGVATGLELHFVRRLGSVTKPTDPFPPMGSLLLMDTLGKVVVVKGPSFPQYGQREKALEAKDPVRREDGSDLVEEREGRSIVW